MKSAEAQRVLKKGQFRTSERWPFAKGRVLSAVCKDRQEKHALLFQTQTHDSACAATGEKTFLLSCCKELLLLALLPLALLLMGDNT